MYMIVYPLNNVVTKKDIKNFKLDPANSHRLYGVTMNKEIGESRIVSVDV